MKNLYHTVTAELSPGSPSRHPAPGSVAHRHGGPRDTEDDFFCLRFSVWYPSFDCAVRTRFRTCSGCRDCEQGRFNLKRHRSALAQVRRHYAKR
jgi:hypothetical protein